MNEIAEKKIVLWAKLKNVLSKKAYWIGSLGLVLTIVMALAVIFFWENIQSLGGYGYLGAFFVGLFGGATYLAPIPMTPVIFALGTVMKPQFAPYMGPVFVGAAAGFGETLAALSIYMTGYGGGAVLGSSKHGRIQVIYSRLLNWMEKAWRIFESPTGSPDRSHYDVERRKPLPGERPFRRRCWKRLPNSYRRI